MASPFKYTNRFGLKRKQQAHHFFVVGHFHALSKIFAPNSVVHCWLYSIAEIKGTFFVS
jgi:hypothetical protein